MGSGAGKLWIPSCNCNTSDTSINYAEMCRKTQSTAGEMYGNRDMKTLTLCPV